MVVGRWKHEDANSVRKIEKIVLVVPASHLYFHGYIPDHI